jgi:prepilin-type N-terminal cleavage/methylation domain-containing protein
MVEQRQMRAMTQASSLREGPSVLWPGRTGARRRRAPGGFTLIELILVMAILTMAVSLSAPVLSHFFRGRSLNSEARRLVALTHVAQSRAASEGVPVDLWIDSNARTYGIETEPSYEAEDPKADQWTLDPALTIEVTAATPVQPKSSSWNPNQPISTASVPKDLHRHPNLPAITFMPDGSIGPRSLQKVRLMDREEVSLWVCLSADRSYYEIRNTDK